MGVINPKFFGFATNCYCPNADARQTLRGQAAFGGLTPKIAAANSCLEAGGQLVDMLDAVDGFFCDGIVLGNVADRHGRQAAWENGSPFGYTFIGRTLLAATLEGEMLSLLKKFELIETVNVLVYAKVAEWAVENGLLSSEKAAWMVKTQFRSYELIRIAYWITRGLDIPSEQVSVEEYAPDVRPSVWYIDKPFGNCKTTLLESEREKTRFASLPYYERLADVPDNTLALVRGSSGIGGEGGRFIEIVINGGNAANELNLKVGSPIS